MRVALPVALLVAAAVIVGVVAVEHRDHCRATGRADCSVLPWGGTQDAGLPSYPCAKPPPRPVLDAIADVTRTRRARSAGTSSMTLGLGMRLWPENDARAAARVHPHLGRFEVEPEQPPRSIEQCFAMYRAMGITPQPVISFSRMPDARQVDAMARWITRLAPEGLKLVELGNEDSFTYKYGDTPSDRSYRARAEAYARTARRLALAVRGTGVGVLVQADDGGTGSTTWIDRMYRAVPDLHRWAAGWVVHPYGPDYARRLAIADDALRGHGGDVRRLYLTEWGLSTDNGRALDDNYGWPTDLTYRQAADILQRFVDDMARSGRVAQLIYFQSTDQGRSGGSTRRESYFGVLQAEGSAAKGALTATAAALLSRHP